MGLLLHYIAFARSRSPTPASLARLTTVVSECMGAVQPAAS